MAPATLLAAALAAQPPLIQDTKHDLFTGMGRVTYGPIHLDAATGQDGALGCAFLNGEIFVSSRGTPGNSAPPHRCYVFGPAGNVVRSFLQPGSAGSAWGWRDGSSDRVGTLVFGYENAFEFVTASGAPASSIRAANGQRPLASSVLTPTFAVGRSTFATMRAVAYDPTGDGGNGSLLAADFGSDIVEFRIADGVEIERIPHDGRWSLFGLAIHPATGQLWGHGDTSGPGGRIIEVDRSTGVPTGNGFDRSGGLEGGLDFVAGGLDGRATGADLVSIVQDLPDLLTGHRLDAYDTVRGTSDVRLLSGLDGAALSDAAVQVLQTSNAMWRLDLDDGVAAPRPLDAVAVMINVGPEAIPNATLAPIVTQLFPALRETRYLDGFTTPPGFALSFGTTEQASALAIPVPSILSLLQHRQFIRVQALYLEPGVPGLPVMLTNQVRCGIDESVDVGFPPATALGVRVSAFGNQSYNANTSSGFWRVANTGTRQVLQVVLTLPPPMVWDEDQGGMADSLIYGNRSAPGCSGTYRNGSAVTTDLDFAPTRGTVCDTTSRRGYTLSVDARTLTFVFRDGAGPNGGFTSGELFEWDADTDGGGVTADAHAGTFVQVWVRDPITGVVSRSAGAMAVVSTTDPVQESAVAF